MKFKEIKLENFGPIEKGTIQKKKINVFFGPNNSGKSIASRLIYGINVFDTNNPIIKLVLKRYSTFSDHDLSDAYMGIILNSAGFAPHEFLTHGKKSGSIEIKSNKHLKFKLNKSKKQHALTLSLFLEKLSRKTFVHSRQSVYIPAGRTGIIQLFTNITRVRERLLNDLLDTLDEHSLQHVRKNSSNEIRTFTHTQSQLPQHLEQFHNLILGAQSDQLDIHIQELFSELFAGSIGVLDRPRHPTVMYKDPTGFITDIESAGSGTVSSFPILAGIYYVNKGGTLIIEEPEAHLEPSKQLKMLGALCQIAKIRDINLVFTTHSDYVVKKLLALVSSGKIKHTDIGMYYFNRKPNKLTHIEKISIDKTGDADQEMFQDALDTLIEEFSE